MIRPSQAEAIERQLISLARSGQIRQKIDDDELRSMLEQVRRVFSPL
jgi:DNA-binding TFAR19-related protein (PDSD5 family)